MVDDDLRDQIARIEADIDELAKTLDGCRKAMLLSKAAIVGGGIWMLVYLLGAISFDSVTGIGAMAVVIGGVVVFGSNSSTSKQTMAAMKAAEWRERAGDTVPGGDAPLVFPSFTGFLEALPALRSVTSIEEASLSGAQLPQAQ